MIAKILISYLLRNPQKKTSAYSNSAGFTLIELLVGLIIAVLVMTPLLGLAINLISTDRREQAKATLEQDLQTAADFIARDLQEAIYLYDSVALTRDFNNVAAQSGIRNQIPPVKPTTGCNNAATCTPVLAFWKRVLVTDSLPIRDNVACKNANNSNLCNDTYVYSLVVYYLIRDDVASNIWSPTSRIGRFEINDGIIDPFDATEYLDNTNIKISPGFKNFDLSQDGDSFRGKMNRWQADTAAYTDRVNVLIDNIDHTAIVDNRNIPSTACPEPNTTANESQAGWLQSPYYGPQTAVSPAPTPPANQFQTYGFYACVNSEQGIARVVLRGNVRALLSGRGAALNDTSILYNENAQSLFPIATSEAEAEGRLVQ